jgi:hypothetical protein
VRLYRQGDERGFLLAIHRTGSRRGETPAAGRFGLVQRGSAGEHSPQGAIHLLRRPFLAAV